MPTDPRAAAASPRVALRRAPLKGAHDRPTIDAILDATPHCHLGHGFHHSANHRSVVVLGDAELVTDHDERLAALEAITDAVVPGRWAELRPPTHKELLATAVVRLPLHEASAKVRTGPPVDEPEDVDGRVWAGVVPVRSSHGPPRPAPDVDDGVAPPPSVRRRVDGPDD